MKKQTITSLLHSSVESLSTIPKNPVLIGFFVPEKCWKRVTILLDEVGVVKPKRIEQYFADPFRKLPSDTYLNLAAIRQYLCLYFLHFFRNWPFPGPFFVFRWKSFVFKRCPKIIHLRIRKRDSFIFLRY